MMSAVHLTFVVIVCFAFLAIVISIFVFVFHKKGQHEKAMLPPYTRVYQVLTPTNPWLKTQGLPAPQFVSYTIPFPPEIWTGPGKLSYSHHSLTVQWNGWRQTGFVGMFQPDDPNNPRFSTHDLVSLPLISLNERAPIQFGYTDVFHGLVQYYHGIPPVLNQGEPESANHGVDLVVGLLENREFHDSRHFYAAYRILIEDTGDPGPYWLAHEASLPNTTDCLRAFHTAYLWSGDNYMEGKQFLMFPVPHNENNVDEGHNLRLLQFVETPKPKFERQGHLVFPPYIRVIRTVAKKNTVIVLCWDHEQNIHRLLQYSFDGSFSDEKEIVAPPNNHAACEHNILCLGNLHLIVGNGNNSFRIYKRTNQDSFVWFVAQDISLGVGEELLDVRVSEEGLLLSALVQTTTQIVLYVWRWDFTSMAYLIDADEPYRFAYTKPTLFDLTQHSFDMHVSLTHRVVQILLLQDQGLQVLQWDI